VSADNVRLVGRLQPPPDRDLATLYRDESTVLTLTDAMAPSFDPAVESRYLGDDSGEVPPNVGLEGLRKTWLAWLEPWQSYRAETIKVIDVGDRVLVVTDEYGREKDATEDVRLQGAAVWTVRNGQVTAIDFYADRTAAFKAVA
jgi:hypothetical protein